MLKKSALAILGLGLAGLGLYRFRRHLWSQIWRLPPVRNRVAVELDLRVPMADGVTLLADHYAPVGAGPFPTILIRSPYGRRSFPGTLGLGWHSLAMLFAERGYHVLVQDVRGRSTSEGEFSGLKDEARDGLSTVEWLATQPWFDGTLGMWGGSYLGYVQWAIATSAPSALKAVMPAMAFSSGYEIAYRGGILALDLSVNVMFLFDLVGARPSRPENEFRWRWNHREAVVAPAWLHLPLLDADKAVVGQEYPLWRETVLNPSPDAPFWQGTEHHDQMGRVTAAPYLFSGWYDLFLRDLMDDYAALKAAGQTPYLTIGPWHHSELGWIIPTVREGLAWFDAHLKGDRSSLPRQPVRYLLMGAGEWREAATWPPPAAAHSYYLQPGGGLEQEPPLPDVSADRYRYDPADPTPNLGGPLLFPPAGAVDQRLLEARSDVLCYTTWPLERQVDVVGPVRLQLYVRSSLPYTDFVGRLCDVYPDGRSLNVCDGIIRLSPGAGTPQPDGTVRIEVDLGPTAQRFRRGHRIRLQVSSGSHPRWNRNLGTGEAPALATTMFAALEEVYHDRAHPSALILPVLAEEA